MSLKERIDSDIKKAMLAKKKAELLALRGIKSAILLAETEKGSSENLTEDKEMQLLMKSAKQRKESAEIYSKEGRQDLADKEIAEFKIISRYLPEQMDEAGIKKVVSEIITKMGAQGMQDMGKVMGATTKQLAGKADGKQISTIVRQLLSPA